MAKKKESGFSRFLNRFSTEQVSTEYLFHVKGPDSFVCPKCGCREHLGHHPAACFFVIVLLFWHDNSPLCVVSK